ncbi:MAG TPA: helix-turn-helix domain-containing protein [Gemmatimonadaceae bacterium]|nr:helix-turn-helix domain-containing protein [Gemmatimonadaceae bacterium]
MPDRRSAASGGTSARVVAFVSRPGVRSLLRGALSKRRGRLVVTRTLREFGASFRAVGLVDAAFVDLGSPGEEGEQAAALARDFPTVAFFGITPFRAVDASRIAVGAGLHFADVVADGVDGPIIPHLVAIHAFSARFAAVFTEPPPALGLRAGLQLAAWRALVGDAGHVVRTSELAKALGVTREHLSRTFSAGPAPGLKRLIDLVRLLVAAELAKNPGYDTCDVARVLGFASSSNLSATVQRLVGTKASALASLRAVDVIARLVG